MTSVDIQRVLQLGRFLFAIVAGPLFQEFASPVRWVAKQRVVPHLGRALPYPPKMWVQQLSEIGRAHV